MARRIGAGDERGAVAAGIDGCWLALVLGVVLAAAGWAASPFLVGLFGASPGVTAQATTYLDAVDARAACDAARLSRRPVCCAGLQDTRTPLAVAVAGFAANILLNYLFIYVARLRDRRLGARHGGGAVGDGRSSTR